MWSLVSEKNNTITHVGVGHIIFFLFQSTVTCYKNVFVNIRFSSTVLRFRLRTGELKALGLHPDLALYCAEVTSMFHVWTNTLRFDISDMFTTNLEDRTHGQHIFWSFTYSMTISSNLHSSLKHSKKTLEAFEANNGAETPQGIIPRSFLCSSAVSKWTLL